MFCSVPNCSTSTSNVLQCGLYVCECGANTTRKYCLREKKKKNRNMRLNEKRQKGEGEMGGRNTEGIGMGGGSRGYRKQSEATPKEMRYQRVKREYHVVFLQERRRLICARRDVITLNLLVVQTQKLFEGFLLNKMKTIKLRKKVQSKSFWFNYFEF